VVGRLPIEPSIPSPWSLARSRTKFNARSEDRPEHRDHHVEAAEPCKAGLGKYKFWTVVVGSCVPGLPVGCLASIVKVSAVEHHHNEWLPRQETRRDKVQNIENNWLN